MDLFDTVDLPIEEKVIFSEEMRALIKEEMAEAIAKIPVGKIITRVLQKELEGRRKENEAIKRSVQHDIAKTKDAIETDVKGIREKWDEFAEKMRVKYDELKSELLNVQKQPRYEFGGFSPLVNDLNIGDPATEGSWRIVTVGTTLSVQRLESNNWVEKGSFVP